MKVYVIHESGYNEGDDKVVGVITDKAVADEHANTRFGWYEEFEVDECLKTDLAYIANRLKKDAA